MSASPSHGERPSLQGGFRRSFTLPARQLSVHERAALDKSDAVAEILYTHSSARIISFSPPTESVRSNNKAEILPDTDYPVDTVETLPWRSRTETLAATGPMIIEKVRGSTNFLKCQGVTHAILRNSQCWCVDGESKFVLRVRKFQYYRIELPSTTDEDKAKVEELKKVFATVLRYERTPCPFIRAFTVELPDDAITPRRKGQWKRRDSSQPNTPETEHPMLRRTQPTRSYSLRTPPTSYPRGGPDASFENERGRMGQVRRSSFLREDYNHYGHSSPNRYAESDDGTESERHESEHDSEIESTTDRSETASPQKTLNKEKAPEILRMPPEEDVAIVVPKRKSIVIQGSDLKPRDQSAAVDNTQLQEKAYSEDTVDNSADDKVSEQSDNKVTETREGTSPVANHEEAPPSKPDGKFTVVAVESEAELPEQDETQVTENSHEEIEDITRNPVTVQHNISKSETSTEDIPIQSNRDNDTQELLPSPSESNVDSSQPDHKLDSIKLSPQDENQPKVTASSLEVDDTHLALETKATPESELLDPSNAEFATNEKQIAEESVLPEPAIDPIIPDGSDSPWEDSNIREIDEQLQELEALQQTTGNLALNDDLSARNLGGESRSSPLFTALLENVELSKPLPRSITLEGADSQDDDGLSTVSSIDSFHTISSAPNEQIYSKDELDPIERGRLSNTTTHHKRELSEITVTVSTLSNTDAPEDLLGSRRNSSSQTHTPSLLSSPTSNDPWLEDSTTSSATHSKDGLRLRKQRKTFSPSPPASTIFTGDQIRHDSGGGHMTKVILQKIIIKPIEMAIFIVHILARIASGATVNDLLSGELFRRPEHHRRISGFADQLHGGKSASDTEDDYGVPVRGRRRSTERRHALLMDEDDEDRLEDID